MASSSIPIENKLISPRRGNLIIFIASHLPQVVNSLRPVYIFRAELTAKVVKTELKKFFRWINELTTFSVVFTVCNSSKHEDTFDFSSNVYHLIT